MSKEENERVDYFESIEVASPSAAKVLALEKVWDILEYVHQSPKGVRSIEVTKEFGIDKNQAYQKLKLLLEYDFIKHKKEKGGPGRKQQRKTLLYVSGIWGSHSLQEDFEELMDEKLGKYVTEKVVPVLLDYFREAIRLKNDVDFNAWIPRGRKYCPDCKADHQALEFFNALIAYASILTQDASFSWNRMLLDLQYMTRKGFEEYTAKSKDDYDWVLSDKQ